MFDDLLGEKQEKKDMNLDEVVEEWFKNARPVTIYKKNLKEAIDRLQKNKENMDV